MLVSYLVSTTLLVWKREFLVLVAYELGNLWVSDLMLVLLYPSSNNVLDLMDCIMGGGKFGVENAISNLEFMGWKIWGGKCYMWPCFSVSTCRLNTRLGPSSYWSRRVSCPSYSDTI